MLQSLKSRTFAWVAGTVVAVAAAATFVVSATAQNKEPIKIGFSMALTGPLVDAVGPRWAYVIAGAVALVAAAAGFVMLRREPAHVLEAATS